MKKLLIPVLIGLFVHFFLEYLWPAFRDNAFDYQWYLMYSGALQVITISLSTLFLIISIVWGLRNNSKNKPVPAIAFVLSIIGFLFCVISVAIKLDIEYYF